MSTDPASLRAENARLRGTHPVITCTGVVNGMSEPDNAGSYVKLVATWPGPAGMRHEVTISRGAAAVLVAEIEGALNKARAALAGRDEG